MNQKLYLIWEKANTWIIFLSILATIQFIYYSREIYNLLDWYFQRMGIEEPNALLLVVLTIIVCIMPIALRMTIEDGWERHSDTLHREKEKEEAEKLEVHNAKKRAMNLYLTPYLKQSR